MQPGAIGLPVSFPEVVVVHGTSSEATVETSGVVPLEECRIFNHQEELTIIGAEEALRTTAKVNAIYAEDYILLENAYTKILIKHFPMVECDIKETSYEKLIILKCLP